MTTTPSRPPLVDVRGLGKRYRSGESALTVFSGLSFAVGAGEMLAVTGESGSGKSTLLHLLAGLDHPDEGSVCCDGRDLFSMSETERAGFRNRVMGYVWQQHALLPEFTAEENAAMPLMISGTPRRDALAQARARLEEVGLGARAGHRPGELSGGEQQRVALARALAARPKLLLADEPTGNLDQATGESVISLLFRLQREHGLACVVVTHNLEFARRCPRVLQLGKGGSPGGPSALA
jgi:lipoprotein-releasing system ATP-binding protein